MLIDFPDQAARFATRTRRETASAQASKFATTPTGHAETARHIDRTVDEWRTAAAALAVEHLVAGRPDRRDLALGVMLDCLTQQAALVKIRPLELVRDRAGAAS